MSATTRRPPGASVPTDPATPGRAHTITGSADILCDGSGRLGLLSYRIPDGMRVVPGDAVRIPFGTRTVYGMVVRQGDPAKATRDIDEVYGKRAAPADIALAESIAKFHFADPAAVYPRLAPNTGRGADPLTDDTVTLTDPATAPIPTNLTSNPPRRLLVRAPLISPAVLAAQEAARISATGQVLILCPTTELVDDVLACFTSGAQRLDKGAPKGAWKGFCLGSVRVGIGTRAAALYSAANLAGLVVVEEDHPGHIEARQPHTHARDIASARSRALRISLTLISANPTPQALGCGVSVHTAGTRRDWPTMRLIDRGQVDPVTRWAPTALVTAIAAEAKAGRKPVVVVQRRAAVRRCERCRTPRACTECTSSLCRHTETTPCPQCNASTVVRMVGWDKARVAELLGKTVRVITLADLPKQREAGLVVLFDIDAATSAAELIPDSLAASLIVTAAKAAGPGGSVIALTDDPDQPVLRDLFGPRDQLEVARRALTAARTASLPPFGRLVTIRCGQDKAPVTRNWPGTVHGPRRTGNEWELLVRVPADQVLTLEPYLLKLRRGGKTRVTVT